MQILSRTGPLPISMICLCTFGLNVRFVFGALRSQRPECRWRMLLPNIVCLPHTSHFPAATLNLDFDARRVPSYNVKIVAQAIGPNKLAGGTALRRVGVPGRDRSGASRTGPRLSRAC